MRIKTKTKSGSFQVISNNKNIDGPVKNYNKKHMNLSISSNKDLDFMLTSVKLWVLNEKQQSGYLESPPNNKKNHG